MRCRGHDPLTTALSENGKGVHRLEPTEEREHIRRYLRGSAEVKQRLAEKSVDAIAAVADAISKALSNGNMVMLCGNGGSAADCQHIAAEFTNRLNPGFDRRALAALALTTDTSFLTACSNDYGFEHIFERQIEALGEKGDILIGISTSGNSENVIRAVEYCQTHNIKTVGFLGGDGGRLGQLVDYALVVPSSSTQHIQEGHIAIAHLICDLVERKMFGEQRDVQEKG